jgi:hypothetical protein
MTLVQCLYCNADNDPAETGAYCDKCGKRLPTSALIQPRKFARSGGGEETTTAAGRQERARASEALLTATIIHIVAGGLFLVLGPALFRPVPEDFMLTAMSWTVGPALALAPLVYWARTNLALPGLIALVLYLIWVGAGFALDATFATPWLLVSASTLAFLAWACRVGLQVARK